MSIKNYIGLVCIVFLQSACTNKTSEEENKEPAKTQYIVFTEAQFKTVGIEYAKVETRKMSAAIKVNGILDVPPQNLITISALMGGFIKSTEMLQGKRVKKGEVLAVIENPEFITLQREYLENKSNLLFIEQDYKRQQEMIKENVSSQKEFQKVSSEYNAMLAAQSALKEKLRMIGISPETLSAQTIKSSARIVSPISGYVTAVNVNIGKYVNPQDIICEIVDTDHLHVELTVFEKDITKIKVGQKVRFNIVNDDSIQRMAHVYLINHKISEDRTVRIHAHMDKDDPSLIPNMYLQAYIEIGEKEVIALPNEAIVSSEDKDIVFLKSDSSNATEHQFLAIEVKKGLSADGYTEVLFLKDINLNAAQFVVNGAYDVLSKMNNVEEEE